MAASNAQCEQLDRLVWGLMRGNIAGWTSPEVVAALAGGLLLAVAFVAGELRARALMVTMRFFRSHSFSSGFTASFLFYAALYATLFFLPQFLQTVQGYGPLGAGLRLLPWTATLFLVAPLAGALVNESANARSLSAACSCKPAEWPGSPSSPGPTSPTPNSSLR